MQISPYNLYSFKGIAKNIPYQTPKDNTLLEGQVLRDGKVFNRHTTTFFRSDLDWEEFGKYIKKKFSGSNKVQTLVWGCSMGDEAYSLAILLKRYFGDKYKKFLPIQAMDIDSKLIEKNNQYKEKGFYLNGDFIEKMKYGLNIPSVRFDLNELGKYCRPAGPAQYQLKSDIMDSVEFETSNILTNTNKIDSSTPSIIMCRNMWPYINSERYYSTAKDIYNRMKKGSILVIGEFDLQGDAFVTDSARFPKALVTCGFRQTNHAGDQNSFYIFEK